MRLERQERLAFSDVGNYDVNLICKEQHFKSHSLLLAASSKFMKDILMEVDPGEDEFSIILPEFQASEVEGLVNLIYGRKFQSDNLHSIVRTMQFEAFMNVQLGEIFPDQRGSSFDWVKSEVDAEEDKLNDKRDATAAETVCEPVIDDVDSQVGGLVLVPPVLNVDSSSARTNIVLTNPTLASKYRRIAPKSLVVGESKTRNKENVKKDVKSTKSPSEVLDEDVEDKSILTTGSDLEKSLWNSQINIVKANNVKLEGRVPGLSPQLAGIKRQPSDNSQKFPCDLCDKILSSKRRLRSHKEKRHCLKNYFCAICKESFAELNSYRNHQFLHESEGYLRCMKCDKLLKNQENLDRHMKIHVQVMKYKCDACTEEFSRKTDFDHHMRKHGVNELMSCCEVCGKSFATEDRLKRHMVVHTGDRPYKCGQCDKAFSFHYKYLGHLKTHTGEKPFCCELCAKCFADRTAMGIHQNIVHKGLKPYTCETCKQSFSTKSHLKTHTRVHTGEKPFGCDICQKKFARSDRLKAHLNVHDKHKQTLLLSGKA